MPDSLAFLQHALVLTFKMSLLIALVAACAGVATSLVLSAFQIQDQTLPYAVKLVVVCATLAAGAHSFGIELVRLVEHAFALVAAPRG
jgi:type III secretion protein S